MQCKEHVILRRVLLLLCMVYLYVQFYALKVAFFIRFMQTCIRPIQILFEQRSLIHNVHCSNTYPIS